MKILKFKQFESETFYNTDSTEYDTQEEYKDEKKVPNYDDYINNKITEKDFPNIDSTVKDMHLNDKITLNDLSILDNYINNTKDYLETNFVLFRLYIEHDELTMDSTLKETWLKMAKRWYEKLDKKYFGINYQ